MLLRSSGPGRRHLPANAERIKEFRENIIDSKLKSLISLITDSLCVPPLCLFLGVSTNPNLRIVPHLWQSCLRFQHSYTQTCRPESLLRTYVMAQINSVCSNWLGRLEFLFIAEPGTFSDPMYSPRIWK